VVADLSLCGNIYPSRFSTLRTRMQFLPAFPGSASCQRSLHLRRTYCLTWITLEKKIHVRSSLERGYIRLGRQPTAKSSPIRLGF
jgi:hypothetical protein